MSTYFSSLAEYAVGTYSVVDLRSWSCSRCTSRPLTGGLGLMLERCGLAASPEILP